MRDAERIIMHDAAVDLFIDGAGALTLPLHNERISPSQELTAWLAWFVEKTYTRKIDEDALHFVRLYQMPDVDVMRIRAEVTAPGILEMEVTLRGNGDIQWVTRGTYCGSFQVWWADDQT